jgi:hypothetical protein
MYLHNLPRSAARTLVISELMYNPEEDHDEIVFDGRELGLDDNTEIVVTYEKRRKRPTHPLFDVSKRVKVPELVTV